VKTAPALDELRDDWEAMAERTANVFGTWEWASAWWRHFGGGREPSWTRCRDADGSTFAVLPLCVERRAGLRIARLVGHGPADELGPLCADVDRSRAAGALLSLLEDVRADVFFAETLRDEAEWPQHLYAAVRATQSSPIIHLHGGTWDDFLAARSGNFRQQVRRHERALQAHGLRYRLCDDRDRLQRDLDLLFVLHSKRWGGRQSEFTRREAFHRDFASLAFERSWLRLWFLELDGAAVAAWYGLRFGAVDFYYQAGRDPAWDRHAVGLTLLAHSVRESIADGMREYRLGRGDEPYKYRFTDDRSEVVTAVLTRGIKGRVAIATLEAARRARARARGTQRRRRVADQDVRG
jgi:CelD/BcsL family acetyltransferase involved in cellulose biosynthesis